MIAKLFGKTKVPTRLARWPRTDVRVGQLVCRTRCHDGSMNAGSPIWPPVRVVELAFVQDRGQTEGPSIALLSDQGWEFVWNLHIVDEGVTDEVDVLSEVS